MATNLDLQQQLNQLLQEQNKLLEASGKLAKDQVAMSGQLVAAMQKIDYKDVTREIEEVNKAVSDSTEKSKALGATNQDVFDKMNSALKEAAEKEETVGKGLEDLTKKARKFATAASAIDGFVQGLRFTGNMLHTVGGAVVGLVGSLGHLAASIISIPFKMLSGLISMSDQGGGSTELQQALEDIRKEFGALKETSGAAIISMARSMKGELAQTGLSVTRIFGNLAERLRAMQEYAHNLGPLFAALAPQFMKNAEAIGAYYKGLGLTDEAQKAVAARSFALGQDVTENLREITNYSQQLSKGFNGAAGSAKEISRDMGTLMADFRHFGGISSKEIGQAVVYFRRLGLEVSKVMGVVEKYDNFEDAANGAAQLSQAFGLNVDALQMMKAQNPAERVEMLRKSFFAAGRSVENMTRQERALLAQQTGLDDSALDLAFSMKNQGMSYDQVTKKADAAKKSQLTQTQAMQALADSIERLVRSGSSGSGGFIDRFIQGFTVGIQRSSEFRRIMRELQIDLRTAYYEGIKVGRAFVDMFPGVKDVFKGIGDLFEPSRFRAMFFKVTEAFKGFFKDMTDNPQAALPKLVDRLKKDFFSWFQGNSQNGQRILDGFKRFFVALSNIAGGLLKVAMTGLKDGIKSITDLITGKTALGGATQARGALGFIGQLLIPIVNSIKEVGPDLWKAIKEMFSAIWTKTQPWLEQNFTKVIGVLAGPALIGMAGRTIATSITGMFAQGLLTFISTGGIGKAFNSIKGLFNRQISQVTEAITRSPTAPRMTGTGGAAAGAIGGAEQAAKAATESRVNWGRALVQMAAITLFVVVGMAGILYAIFRFAKAMQENRLTPSSILGAAGAMATTATAMLAIAGAVKMLSTINLNMGMVGRILTGLAIVGLTGVAMAAGAYALVQAFGDIPLSKIGKTVTMMAATGTFFLAAAGVAAIAGLVGAMALAGGGIGALTIAAGLATIAATVEVMVQQGMRVMQAIDQFRPGPGFAEKTRVFVELMKGVGQFAGSVAAMVTAARPGILDFLRGAGAEEQRATLRQVESTITILGSQIVRILDAIRSNIQQLSGSERELKSAQIIGELLNGVGTLANALKPPSEVLQEPGFMAQLNGDTVARRISLMTDYVNQVGSQLNLFMRSVIVMITRDISSGFTDAQVKAAQVIPTVLAGVGDLAQALRPSAALLAEMNRGAEFHGIVQHMGNFIRETMRTITTSDLFNQIGNLLNTVSRSVGSLNPAQSKALQTIGPVIGPIFSTVANLGSMIAGLASGRAGGDVRQAARVTPADAGTIFNMVQLVNAFFSRIREDLPRLVTGMREAFAGMNPSQIETLSKGLESLQKFFEVVSRVPQFIESFRASGSSQTTSMRDIGHTMNLLLLALIGGGGNQGIIPIIQTIMPQLNAFASTLGNPTGLMRGINAVKGTFEVLGKIPEIVNSFASLGNIATVTETVTNQIERIQFARIGTVVTDMVAQVNQLSTTIRGIHPIEIEQSLQRLGDSIGLGSDGDYTIQNRNFTINLTVAVRLDNNGLDALELAMLRRVGPHPTRITHGALER